MNQTVNPNVSEMAEVLAGIPAGGGGEDENVCQCQPTGSGTWHSQKMAVPVEGGRRRLSIRTSGGGRRERPTQSKRSGSARRQAEFRAGFFQRCLAAHRGTTPEARRDFRCGVYQQVREVDRLQGKLSVERMCWLGRVSRAGYYRAWAAAEPDAEEMDLRNHIQRIAVEHRHYGYRRVTAQLRRQGRAVNHKRVARLLRLDNLLALRRVAFRPPTTDSAHGL